MFAVIPLVVPSTCWAHSSASYWLSCRPPRHPLYAPEEGELMAAMTLQRLVEGSGSNQCVGADPLWQIEIHRIHLTARHSVTDGDGQYLDIYINVNIDEKPLRFVAASPHDDLALLEAPGNSLSCVLHGDIQRLLLRQKLFIFEFIGKMALPKHIQANAGCLWGFGIMALWLWAEIMTEVINRSSGHCPRCWGNRRAP